MDLFQAISQIQHDLKLVKLPVFTWALSVDVPSSDEEGEVLQVGELVLLRGHLVVRHALPVPTHDRGSQTFNNTIKHTFINRKYINSFCMKSAQYL